MNREFKRVETKDFYPIMQKWWEGHKFNIVPLDFLPTYTYVILDNNSTPLYSMCVYNTDSELAWVAWQLSNPFISKEDKEGGLKELFTNIVQLVKSQGYKYLFTTSSTKKVVEIMNDLDFQTGDTQVNHYIKLL